MNEAELVECCKRKDMTAQNELYQRYAGEMFALCIRYSGNRDSPKIFYMTGSLKPLPLWINFSTEAKAH